MKIARIAFGTMNRLLSAAGLELRQRPVDFHARLSRPEQLRRMFRGVGDPIDAWLATQKLFTVRNKLDSAAELASFYEKYLISPFRDQGGGSRFNNQACLYLLAKAMQPSVIIDSGTYKGASAWAFTCAATQARIYSFDIDLSRLALKANGVSYFEMDWTAYDWTGTPLSDALIYFDDHLDQVRRLIEASARGISVAIFDDDFPVTSVAGMAHGGLALPKIEFVLDDHLYKEQEFAWIDSKGEHRFPVDAAYLDRARSLIEATERLPNTSLVTGIHQTPYRIVKIRPSRS